MILDDSVVGYIDFGITGVMSPYSRSHLMVMTLGLAQGDMESLNEQFLKLSAFGPQSDLEGFRSGLDRLAGEWYEVEGRQRRLAVAFTRVMTDMLHLSRSKGVMPERDIIKYIRSAIAIDGLIIRFETDFHVGRYLEETCARFLRWQSLGRSLSSDGLLDWSASGARLMTEGALRSGQFLERLARGDLRVRAELGASRAENEDVRSRAVLLAATVLALTFLMAATGAPTELGWNLFTAELAVILTGLGLLVPALARLNGR
jgi:predicted unusual protein kinase regulating ubiquinone biosynthesis (AarF/ABC1/UbiB family)